MRQQCPISASTSIYNVRTLMCLCDENQLFEERLDPVSDSDSDVCFEPPLRWSWECWRNRNKIPRSLAWSFKGSTWRKRQVLLSSLWLRPFGSPAWTADTNTHQGEVEIAHASTKASALSSKDFVFAKVEDVITDSHVVLRYVIWIVTCVNFVTNNVWDCRLCMLLMSAIQTAQVVMLMKWACEW